MFGILLLLFTVVPALEFYLLFNIGSQIGAFYTFSIIILTGIAGAGLAKTQGLIILSKVQSEISGGKLPGDQILHGFLVFGGGLLLLTPGFLTDITGFCMVIPGSRHIILVFIKKMFKNGIQSGNIKFSSFGSSFGTSANFQNMNNQQQSPFSNIENDPDIIDVDFKERSKEK